MIKARDLVQQTLQSAWKDVQCMFMSMKLLDQVKKDRGLTNYGVAKQLRSLGVEITTQGIDQYDKGKARSMRLDVLCGLKALLGARWETVGRLLEEEFGHK